MINAIMRWRALSLPALAAGAAMLASTPANAWWRGGVWIGVPPVVVGAPAYYPPAYYPPAYYPYYYPPYYYGPPPAQTPVPPAQTTPAPQNQSSTSAPVAYGAICHAGFYSCAAAPQSPVGSGCACPGIGAPSYGVVN
jgi:hypothetical protein